MMRPTPHEGDGQRPGEMLFEAVDLAPVSFHLINLRSPPMAPFGHVMPRLSVVSIAGRGTKICCFTFFPVQRFARARHNRQRNYEIKTQ